MQGQHPQAFYRQKLLQDIVALAPRRILEVGCGGGGFLRSALNLGADLHGIDPDEDHVVALRRDGFSVETGRAEHLQHADDSFDVVVFCFTAHHIENWDRALREAMRVGQTVFVLDPWYELGIESQAVAAKFDRWCKAIDRAAGMVHNDCMDTEALLKPLNDRLGDLEITVAYLLTLHELGVERMLEFGSMQLRKAPEMEPWKSCLNTLALEADAHGFSDDGAILLSISWRDRG